MCGIFGIVGTGNSGGQPGAMADMGMTLSHRGPDHAGLSRWAALRSAVGG